MSLLCNCILNLITLDNLISATDKIKISCLLCYLIPTFKARLFHFIYFPQNSICSVPFTALLDIQVHPWGAEKAVQHQGSSRWCLVTSYWCFLQSLKWCSDRAELTAESCNYFQVTEKCHSQKAVGIYHRGRCSIGLIHFVCIFRSSPRDFVAVFVAAIQNVLPFWATDVHALVLFLKW